MSVSHVVIDVIHDLSASSYSGKLRAESRCLRILKEEKNSRVFLQGNYEGAELLKRNFVTLLVEM